MSRLLVSRTVVPLAIAAPLLMTVLLGMAPRAVAELPGEAVPEVTDVGVDEKRGDSVSLDLTFRDESGTPLTLKKYFHGERPVLLSLNYSDCPMLCGLQLNGLVNALREMEWTAGEEFDVVSVSIDPREPPERARQTKKLYATSYGRPGGAQGWHFLVGSQESITQLADAVGFRYQFVPDTGEFAHTAALMVMSPEGMISRYLYGVDFDPQTVRLSLVEASEGKVGSAMDQVLLYCFRFDHTKGRYGPQAFRIMQVGAATTVVVLGVVLVPFWFRHRKLSGAASSAASSPPADTSVSASPPVE